MEDSENRLTSNRPLELKRKLFPDKIFLSRGQKYERPVSFHVWLYNGKMESFYRSSPSPLPLTPGNIIKIYDRPHVPYSASHPISSWYEINFYEQFAFPLLRFIDRLKSYWNKCRISRRIIFENIGFRDRRETQEIGIRYWNLINLAINEQ